MKRILTYIWQKKFTILIAVFFIALFIASRIFKEEPKPTNPPSQARFNDLIPGVSSESDVKSKLGEPEKTVTEEDKTVLEYKVTGSVRYQDAVVKDGKVIFI